MVLRQSHAAAYGGGALELIPGYDEPGCPRLYEAKYVKRSIPAELAPHLEYGTAIHNALRVMEDETLTPDEALREIWPPGLGPERFDEAMRDLRRVIERGGALIHTIATEEELTAHLYEDEDFGAVSIGGRLDRIGIDGVNEARLYFDDYKTDRRPPSYANLDRWIQGRWYAALLRANAHRYLPEHVWDRVEIIGRYEAVKWYTLERQFTDDEIEIFLAWAESIARRILRDKAAQPVLNPGCGWCPIRHDCPAWNSLPGEGSALLERITPEPLEDRVALSEEAQEIYRKLKVFLDDVEAALREKVQLEGEVVAAGKRWWLEPGELRWADPRRLHSIMGEDFYGAVRVTLGSVDDWVEEHPEKEPEVKRAIDSVPAKDRLKSEEVVDE